MTNMKGYDPFEHSIRESLGSYEVPYNSADWNQLERRMDQRGGSGRSLSAGLIALLFGGTVAAGSALWLMLRTTPADGTGTAADMGLTEQTAPQASMNTWAATATEPSTLASDDQADQDVVNGTAQDATHATHSTERKAPHPASSGVVQPAGDPDRGAETVNKEVAIRPSITTGCPGTTVVFDAQNLPEGGIYLWNFGDGSFSNKPSPSHTFSKSGVFEVMLSHSSMGGGNIFNKPASDRIVIHEVPEASFNYLKQEYDNSVPSVHFENRSMGAKSYTWDFGDGTTSSTPHPDHVYKQKGAYHVTLTVTNANGCSDRTERTVRVDEDYNLLAPKTFSPNGDGVEDTFMPDALKVLGVKFNLTIHDPRTGQLVFESTDAQRTWNGRIGGKGELCAPGEYVWMVEMKDGEKLGGTYNGNVNLLR
jgi:gliding motility-associated-like protein